MRLKKWLPLLAGLLAVCVLLLMAGNVLLDPFGVFGDRILNWRGYDMAMNPQVAKIEYLDRCYEEYDSYLIGSARASSLSVTELNGCLNARFYDLTGTGGDLADQRELVRYIAEHYTVKNLVLAVEPRNAERFGTEADGLRDGTHYKVDGSPRWRFYLKYLFAGPQHGWSKLLAYSRRDYLMSRSTVCDVETGGYDRRFEDALPVRERCEYPEGTASVPGGASLPYVDEAAEAVADIKAVCEDEGIRLTVVGLPLREDEFYRYDQEQMSLFWEKLADVTDFYDFWGRSSVNRDARYYYDGGYFRGAVGTMMLACMFGDGDAYRPDDFGRLTTRDSVEERIAAAYGPAEPGGDGYAAKVPVLMYHAFTEDPEAATSETAYIGDFEAHVLALKEAGFHPVSYRALVEYVYRGAELPEKPVVITMDDGYRSNLDLAVPILEREGFCAVIAVIGCSVGKDTYKDTGTPINPHFALEDAEPYVESGLLDIQTHSYDMHQVKKLDGEDCRFGALRMRGETEADYARALTEDFLRSKEQIESVLDVDCNVYTYPHGACDTLSEAILHGLGIQVSVTVDPGVNEIVKGLPQSLYQLKRINVAGGMSAAELLEAMADAPAGG